VEFGISNADGELNARAAGAEVVAVMAPCQINPRCIMVHASSGIHRIEGLAEVALALSQRPALSHYLRWRYPSDRVTIVPLSRQHRRLPARPALRPAGLPVQRTGHGSAPGN